MNSQEENSLQKKNCPESKANVLLFDKNVVLYALLFLASEMRAQRCFEFQSETSHELLTSYFVPVPFLFTTIARELLLSGKNMDISYQFVACFFHAELLLLCSSNQLKIQVNHLKKQFTPGGDKKIENWSALLLPFWLISLAQELCLSQAVACFAP